MISLADDEGVWSWHPWAGAKRADDDPRATVTKKSWTPGRARSKPLKPFACGNAGVFRWTCGDLNSCAYFPSHARLRVHWTPGIPHALFGRSGFQNSGASCRENGLPRLSFFDILNRLVGWVSRSPPSGALWRDPLTPPNLQARIKTPRSEKWR